MGVLAGAGGVFVLGPFFQVSLLNVGLNVRGDGVKMAFCAPLFQKTKNVGLNIQVYSVEYAVYFEFQILSKKLFIALIC